MKKTHNRLVAAGFTAFVVLAVSTVPARSECIKTSPLFGLKVYMDDKYCQKKTSPKKIKRKRTKRVAAVKKKTAPGKLLRIAHKKDNSIQEMQTLLAGLGYDPGPIDGYKGPQTSKAAKAFKKAVGLRAGTDTEETVEVLKRLSGK